MKLSLPEFDEYIKKLVSSTVKKEPLKYFQHNYDSYYGLNYLVDINHTFNIVIKGGISGYTKEDNPIIKTGGNPNISFGNGLKFLHYSHVNKKPEIHDKYKALLEKLPELVITTRDINHASIYLTNKSNLREFEKDIKRISLVTTISKEDIDKGLNTLFVRKLPNGRFVLKYNPEFIARCITEDYIYYYAELPGYENYKGAFTSFCYVIGHELMHYRNNHFSNTVQDAIRKLICPIPFKAPLNDKKTSVGKEIIDSIINTEAQKFPEYQNNAHMSNILGVTTADMGLGRLFHSKSDNYGGLYSGYLKFDARDKDENGKSIFKMLDSLTAHDVQKLAKNGWAFKDIKIIAINKPVNMKDLRDRSREPDSYYSSIDRGEIIWPYITPYPTDEDISKFLTIAFLTYLPVSDDALKEHNPEVITGYQVGDKVVIKKTGQRGIIQSIDPSGEISVALDDIGIADEIFVLLDQISDLRQKIRGNKIIKSIFVNHRLDDYSPDSEIKKHAAVFSKKELEQLKIELTTILNTKIVVKDEYYSD